MVINFRSKYIVLIAFSVCSGCQFHAPDPNAIPDRFNSLSDKKKMRPDGRLENLAIQAGMKDIAPSDVDAVYFVMGMEHLPPFPPATGPVTSPGEIAKIIAVFRVSSRIPRLTEDGASMDHQDVWFAMRDGHYIHYSLEGYPDYEDFLGPKVAKIMKKFDGTTPVALVRNLGIKRYYGPQTEDWVTLPR